MLWDSAALNTTFVSAVQLLAQITAEEVASEGPAAVTVRSPAEYGGLSNAVRFEVAASPVKIYLPLTCRNR